MNANRIHAEMEVNVSTAYIPSHVYVYLVMVDTTVLLVSYGIYIHFKLLLKIIPKVQITQ